MYYKIQLQIFAPLFVLEIKQFTAGVWQTIVTID